MKKASIIALNTLKEAIRNRIVYAVMILMLLGLLASQLLTPLTMGEQIKVIQDFSMTFINFFSIIVTVFVGTSVVRRELDLKTIQLILSRPIHRYQFIIGKFLGMVLLDIIIIFIMGMGVMLNIFLINKSVYYSMWYFHEIHYIAILEAIAFMALQLILINAVSVFFSAITSSAVIGALFTFFLYVVGMFTQNLNDLLKMVHKSYITWIIKIIYYAVPNFSTLDLKNEAIYGIIPNINQALFLFSYVVLYTGFLLIVAILIFENKEIR
ncbi:MAG: ABC transporter permease [Deltaproteobacteria bacterium]|nr:ABC transporter permease [Deltaproteobacteria bacterium]